MMFIQISNYLFMGSLFLLMVTLIYYGIVARKGPEFFLIKAVKSYLFWISIAGIAVAIVITL